MALFFPSRKDRRQDNIRQGALDRRSTVKNLLGLGDHQKNLRREFRNIADQKRQERRQIREQWRLREKDRQLQLDRRKKYYDTKYQVETLRRKQDARLAEAEKLATKWFEKEKRESDLKTRKEKQAHEYQLDAKYKDLRREAVQGLREQYSRQVGTEASRQREQQSLDSNQRRQAA